MKIRDRLVDLGYWLGWNTLWTLPSKFTRFLFDLIAKVSWKRHGRGIKQLELNLGRVLGVSPESEQIRILSLRVMRSYMRYYWETFQLSRLTKQEVVQGVTAINASGLSRSLENGGAILTLPHSGNWDLAGAWAASYFGSLCTVAERLRPEGVFQKFLKMRTDLGIQLMPLTGDGGTYEYLRSHVTDGRLVALLGDRDVAKSGMSNEFFGHRASLPIGAALLAIDTGRPLFTCATHYDGSQLVITFDDEIVFPRQPVVGRDRLRLAQEVTALIARNFETHIAAHPENWHQLQPVWNDLSQDSKDKS